MDVERWQRLNELFHAAVAIGDDARCGFLVEECGSDVELREAIERLVRAHERVSLFATSTRSGEARGAATDDAETMPGGPLGSYRVVRELGRGGMGTVYLAERADEQFVKQVAIKVVKRGMDTDAILRQFRNERQILASLEHPNIAHLLDGGSTDDGRPFLVMEYVEGVPIDDYCESRGLSIEERLRLFLQVCSAVSHAHEHLVVHRDVKPSNILVGTDGALKLLDFGIARIMATEELRGTAATTLASMHAMTPEYASPEQIRGEPATTRSDVYSLGVVLYELLTGRLPFRFESRLHDAVSRTLLEEEPVRPSEAGDLPRHRQLRGDLDTIVLTAMHRERDRRYRSVAHLADDIRRHLVGLPIAARADSVAYRTVKFVSRNRVAVGAGAGVALTLVAGIVATTSQARRARAEQARAEQRFDDLRSLARNVLFDYHDAIRDLPGSTSVRARLVSDALEYLDRLSRELPSEPSLLAELAAAYERVGEIQGGTLFSNLGDTAGALESYRKAVELREALESARADDGSSLLHLGIAHRKLGQLLWETGDVEGALVHTRRALALIGRLSGGEVPLEIAVELIRCRDYLAMILQDTGALDEARHHYDRSRRDGEGLATRFPKEPLVRRTLSTVYEHIGTLELQEGDLESALATNRRALEIRAALVAENPLSSDSRRNLLVSYYNDGEILAKLSRTEEALSRYRQALEWGEALMAEDPSNEQYRGDVAYALLRVGDMLLAGSADEALGSYRASLELRESDVEADPTNLWKRCSLIEARDKISRALARMGSSEAALSEAEQVVALMAATTVEPTNARILSFFADTHAGLARTLTDLGQAEWSSPSTRERGQLRACDLWRRSLDLLELVRERGPLDAVDDALATEVSARVEQCRRLAAA